MSSVRDPIVRAQIPPDKVGFCALGAPSSVIMVRSNESEEFALLVVSAVLMSFTIFNFISIYYYISETKGLSRKNTQRLSFIHSILVVPPVASALALLICIAPRLNLYLDFIRVTVFAFSMNGLFNLIFDYFDGFEKFLKVVKRKKWTMQVFICRFCCCCFPLQRTNRAWFSNLWWGAYQPPLIRAGLTLVSVLLLAEGLDSTILTIGSLFINLVSTGFGVFCLAILSENIQDAASMFMIREKFFNFRLSLIILNIQPIVIGLCPIQCVYPISDRVRGTLMHNQLVIIEMFMLSLFQRYLWMYAYTEDEEIEALSQEHLLKIPESAGQRISNLVSTGFSARPSAVARKSQQIRSSNVIYDIPPASARASTRLTIERQPPRYSQPRYIQDPSLHSRKPPPAPLDLSRIPNASGKKN